MIWQAVLFRDGEPVTGPVEVTDWEAAAMMAPFFTVWGTVSVHRAVLGARPAEPVAPTQLELGAA